jgi:hypothetical protein
MPGKPALASREILVLGRIVAAGRAAAAAT